MTTEMSPQTVVLEAARRAQASVRGAHPDHFDAAVRHGLTLVASGVPLSMLGALARGAAARGLCDAADGFTHARLRLMVTRVG